MNARDVHASLTTPGASEQPSRRFGLFIELEKRIRHAEDLATLGFLLVNETHHLVRYRQALLWQADGEGGGKVLAVSGLVAPDPNAPFIQWMARVCRHVEKTITGEVVRPLEAGHLPPELAQDWSQWLPSHCLWIALQDRQGRHLGALLLARPLGWSDSEKHLLTYLADCYGHAWAALGQRQRPWLALRKPSRQARWGLIAALALLSLFPIRQSALAPATLVAQSPAIVRAPIDGVVERFEVQPNALVRQGDVLLTLDITKLDSRLKVVQRSLEVSQAELRQAEQKAVFDEASRATLAILKSRVQQQQAEVDYVRGLIERSQVRSPRDGMAVFDNVNDWLGRPVTVGEKILTLASPGEMELEMWLPVADAMLFPDQAQVRLFLNARPYAPVQATLRYSSYEAQMTPEGHFAYRLVATLQEVPEELRIGLKGTAKVYGEYSPLMLYLLRKPIVAVRQYLGW